MSIASEWKPAAGYSLEPNAYRAATETDGNFLVAAGPGAGKTEMLAQRADFLLRNGLCPYPRRILAVAFKTDAAVNLRSRVILRCGYELGTRIDSFTFHAFAKRVIDRFRPLLTGKDALDVDYEIGLQRIERRMVTFNDLVPLASEILNSSSIARNALRNTYSHVFLDEFQDCTNSQYNFVRLAFGSSGAILTAVGDTKQRIMSWAGALDGVFQRFAAEFDADVATLYQNFRSAPRLRRMQNAMVKQMDPPAAVDDAELLGDEGLVSVLRYQDCTSEAANLAELIDGWITNDGLSPSEIAVLVRQQPELFAGQLISQLESRSIAYRNEAQLQDDLSEPLGQLITDFLAVTLHRRQPDAYRRLIKVLVPTTDDDERDHEQAAFWREYLDKAASTLRRFEEGVPPQVRVATSIKNLVEAIGRERLLALSPAYTVGTRFDQLLESLIIKLSKLAEHSNALESLTQVTDDGAVRILTIHKAKGLEFHTVIVLGVEEETFWSKEERAEFFVAISRSKERLLLTCAESRVEPLGAKHWSETRSPHAEFLNYAVE